MIDGPSDGTFLISSRFQRAGAIDISVRVVSKEQGRRNKKGKVKTEMIFLDAYA